MISLNNLPEIFSLFGIGVGCGVVFMTLFFIIGSMVGFLYSLANK